MIKKYLGVALIAASLAVVGCSSDDDDEPTTPDTMEPGGEAEPAAPADDYDATANGATENIAAIVTADPQFSTLLAALNAADLAGTLSGDEGGPFTVFAPTNAAFETAGITEASIAEGNPDAAALAAVLQFHVVGAGAYDSAQLSANSGSNLTMLDGNTALIGGGAADDDDDMDEEGDGDIADEAGDAVDEAVEDAEEAVDEATGDDTDAAEDAPLTIAGAEVTTADVFATNGIVHVIDTVLTPPAATEPEEPVAGGEDLFSVISADPELSTLAGFLESTSLNLTLGDVENNQFTVFAPTNAAFEAIDTTALESDPDALNAALLYHVSSEVQSAADLQALAGNGGTLAMTSGGSTEITVDGDSVLVNGNAVTEADISASNGVVHKIGGVLLDDGAAVEDPAADPTVEDPAVEDPAVEEPADEDPAVEEPAVEEPVVDDTELPDDGDEVVPPAAP